MMPFDSYLPKELQTKFPFLVEPAKTLGFRLGDRIADGWDNLVDRLARHFSSTSK